MRKSVLAVLLALAAPAAASPPPGSDRGAAEGGRNAGRQALERRLTAALSAAPDDPEILEKLVRLNGGRGWAALGYLDRLEASPRSSLEARAMAARRAGELRLQLGDLPGAEADFRRAAVGRPGDADLPRLIAEAKREHPEEALPFAEQAAAFPGASPAARARAALLAGRLRADQGDAAGAEKSLALALRDEPEDLETLVAAARLARPRKTEAAALAARADRAAAASPLWERAAAYREAARGWIDLGEASPAYEDLLGALRLNSEDLDALSLLARLKGRLTPAQLQGARRGAAGPAGTAAAAGTAAPGDLEALRREALAKLSDPAAAEEAAARLSDAAWKAAPWRRESAARMAAETWAALGRVDEACELLGFINDLQSNSLENYRLALRLPACLPDLDEAGWVPTVYAQAALLRLELGDRAGAEAELRDDLKMKPGDPDALRLLESLTGGPKTKPRP